MNISKAKNELKKEYFSWLSKKQENYKPIISNALDSIFNVYSNQFDMTDIEYIKKGLELNHTICWALGEHVNKLAVHHEIFVDLIKRLSKHRSSNVRFNIITNCLYNTPEQLTNHILEEALNDVSKRVRLKAADVILRLSKENLARKLMQQATLEKDNEVKEILIWTYELIDKKWSYRSSSNFVSVHLTNGGIGGFYLAEGEDITDLDWVESKVEQIRKDS